MSAYKMTDAEIGRSQAQRAGAGLQADTSRLFYRLATALAQAPPIHIHVTSRSFRRACPTTQALRIGHAS